MNDYLQENRRYWDAMAEDWVAAGETSWRQDDPSWGIWGLPEAELKLLPASMTNQNAIELGCGTGYVSAWMHRRGASVVGIDNSAAQLATAARLAAEHDVPLKLIHGNAEQVPLPDESFDFAISEYGAAIWCDPVLWIPEAHRLLRPGGQLTFLGCHPLAALTAPESGDVNDERLHRPYFGLHRLDWREVEVDPGGVEFNLPISGWLKLFRETGFRVLDYQELQAPTGPGDDRFQIPRSWGQRWPSEQVWHLEKLA